MLLRAPENQLTTVAIGAALHIQAALKRADVMLSAGNPAGQPWPAAQRVSSRLCCAFSLSVASPRLAAFPRTVTCGPTADDHPKPDTG